MNCRTALTALLQALSTIPLPDSMMVPEPEAPDNLENARTRTLEGADAWSCGEAVQLELKKVAMRGLVPPSK